MGKKQELGKGIRALLNSMDNTKDQTENPAVESNVEVSISYIKLEHIHANPDQPRKDFDQEALEELARSIKAMGIIQPLTLRKMADNHYQIIAGERRFRASQIVGLREVPAYIRKANDTTLLEMALVENIQRKDLNAVEVAISFDRLIRECQITQEELSERVGKKRSTITNYLRLLKLPPEVQKAVKAELISMGHAKALAGIEDPLLLMDIFKEVLESGLSVRKTESLVAAYQTNAGSEKEVNLQSQNAAVVRHSPELRRIIEEISASLGTKVKVDRNAQGKGKISIPFKNDQELNFILEIMEDL